MSATGDITENLDDENKVIIEETCVNLDCVKKEPKEEAFHLEDGSYAQQYRIPLEYENIFEQSTSPRKFEEDHDNLIGFLDNDVVMENTMVKLEYVKEEDESFNSFHCSKCKGNYKGYCSKCSTLACILNNNALFINPEFESNTIPPDILEIRDTSAEKGVFLLRTLPINIIFGPFEGVLAIESIVGYCWKISDNKLVIIKNGNWMKNVVCATNASFKNLDIFQSDGYLYFQTNREITEGEKLLIYFDDKELQPLDNSDECLYTPQKKKMPKIFACTLCYLGFSSNKCLVEHKRKCPRMEESRSMKDFEIIECHYCKMWMEKWEHAEYHVAYCLEIHHRKRSDLSNPIDRTETVVKEMEVVSGTYQRDVCSRPYDSRDDLNFDTKDYQCFSGINHDIYLNKHALTESKHDEHTENAIGKKYKCLECPYQANAKMYLQLHLNKHRGIKQYQCDTCMMKFTVKSSLKRHVQNKHVDNGSAKDYECSECFYQTNYKNNLNAHMITHTGNKPFECNICMITFTSKGNLMKHIMNKHTKNETTKRYKCSACSYETDNKQNLNKHINTHTGIKPFECNICMKKFTEKGSVTKHIKKKHTESGSAKDYKCPECSYATDNKHYLNRHINTHRGIKPFECNICMIKFTSKSNLNKHTKNKHTQN